MAFTFARFRKSGEDSLEAEQRLYALSGYALYVGQALIISGGKLCPFAAVGDRIYAISNVSAASSVITADYIPEVYPVNDNQIWKTPFTVTATAADLPGAFVDVASAGTGISGGAAGTGAYYYDVATAASPTSAAYVIFVPEP